MAILCYVTEHIRNDVTSIGIAKGKIESFAKEVESRQSLSGFDHFPPPCLTKKRLFGYNYRMIAVEKRVGEHLIIVFLRLVVRGGNEYSDFLRDPPGWAARYYDSEIDAQQMRDWVDNRTEIEPPPPPPDLTETEKTFLWSSAYPETYDDVMICETQDWIDSIAEPRVASRLILMPELILRAIEASEGQVHTFRADDRLVIQAAVIPTTRQCVLLRASYGDSEPALDESQAEWQSRLFSQEAPHVLRYSRRSYPSIVCCEPDIWMTIQKDPQANLALSTEEADVLRASSLQDSSASSLPLFINGRAGSGKSTLLQYLFAHAFLRWGRTFDTESEKSSRPLYFASSPELLNVAKDVVNSLLNANHQQLISGEAGDANLLGDLDGCFQEVLKFMRSLLEGPDIERFNPDKFVGYADFRRLWTDRFGHEKQALRNYGPQVSWHVIRGLIKGMSIDGTLERDDYGDLPEDERSVSRQVYEAVYDRVWLAWYQPLCRDGNAWDSQDLVRHLIENDLMPETHCAVLCDEAQDFTRVELEAIYRCSLFSNRQIDFQSVKRVPFVFAGDPFQTLNPTGFRWESVRAAFTERILRALYRFNSRSEVPQLNYRELTYNYRSSFRIVQFCNSIQATRASLFDHRSLGPQSTWQVGIHSSPPVFFEKGDAQMEQALRDQSDLVLIVPCEEGEEVEFVATDDYLKRFVQFGEDGTPRNVLSAARSKGLEFLRVALYGWSYRREAAELSKMIRSRGSKAPSIDEKLTIEYYLNNLYVAASRARRRLFIIDDRESLEKLWWFATDEEHLAQILNGFPKKDVWEKQTGVMVRGIPENFSEDRDDPRTVAEGFERDGLSKEDGYLLRQAALQFDLAGIESKALECRAVAALFDGRFREAGKQFELASLVDRSLDAFWRGKHYAEIGQLVAKYSQLARHPRSRVSSFLQTPDQTFRGCISLFESLLENARINEDLRKDFTSPIWIAVANECLQATLDKSSDVDSDDANNLTDRVKELAAYGLAFQSMLVAKLQFVAKRYADVMATIGRDNGSEMYKDARALHLMSTEGGSGALALASTDAHCVAEYLLRKKRYGEASMYFLRSGDAERLLECLRAAAESNEGEVTLAIAIQATEALVSGGHWPLLISLLTAGDPRGGNDKMWNKSSPAILRALKGGNVPLRIAVPRLARSEKLVTADHKAKEEISEFLANLFIRKDAIAKWWDHVTRGEAGAAIERAGRDITALEFYEKWRDSATTHQDKRYAENRWAICKMRQATREEAEGNRNKAAMYRVAAETVVRRYGFVADEITDNYPKLPPIESRAVPATKQFVSRDPKLMNKGETQVIRSGKIGGVTFRVITARGWVNFESEEGLCARALILEKCVTSDDVSFVKEKDDIYFCPDWGLRVTLSGQTGVILAHGSEVVRINLGEGERESI